MRSELQLAFARRQGRFEHGYCKFDIFGGLAQNGCCLGVRRTVGELAAMYGARSQSLNLDLIHIAFPRSLPGTGAQMAQRTGPIVRLGSVHFRQPVCSVNPSDNSQPSRIVTALCHFVTLWFIGAARENMRLITGWKPRSQRMQALQRR